MSWRLSSMCCSRNFPQSSTYKQGEQWLLCSIKALYLFFAPFHRLSNWACYDAIVIILISKWHTMERINSTIVRKFEIKICFLGLFQAIILTGELGRLMWASFTIIARNSPNSVRYSYKLHRLVYFCPIIVIVFYWNAPSAKYHEVTYQKIYQEAGTNF